MLNLSNADKELLMHKLYKTLTVLPLGSLLTEDNLKNVVFNKTTNIVEKADGSTYNVTKEPTVNHKHLKQMCEYFYPIQFAPIIVNQRPDGSYFIVDGMHRLLAADSMGWTTIPCYVLQIPCGDEYARYDDNGNFIISSGGVVAEEDIRALINDGDLLKVL